MSIKLPKIHLDSGNPDDTKRAKGLLGFIDGQTTNPSLVTKNPDVQAYLSKGKKLTEKELLDMYRDIISEISKEIAGPISVETYADWDTKAEQMLSQADEMSTWARNVYIKFPTLPEGLKAAHEFTTKGGRVNMTLVFNQQQAAGVYAATMGSTSPTFVSPFIGRWDDRGYDGLDLVKNIIKMYRQFDKKRDVKNSHMLVLAASIRNLNHFYNAIFMGADILTVPLSIIRDWVQEEKWVPDEHYRPEPSGLKSLLYQDLPLHTDYTQYEISNEEGSLLSEGLSKFIADWKSVLQK